MSERLNESICLSGYLFFQDYLLPYAGFKEEMVRANEEHNLFFEKLNVNSVDLCVMKNDKNTSKELRLVDSLMFFIASGFVVKKGSNEFFINTNKVRSYKNILFSNEEINLPANNKQVKTLGTRK